MKRPAALVVAVVVVVALFFILRGGKDDAKPAPKAARTENAQPQRPSTRQARQFEAPEVSFLMDDDVEGTLRLEGQVIDGSEDPVGGATVRIDTNPSRTATTEQDGTFYFDKLVSRRYELVAQSTGGVAGPVTARLTDASDPIILRLRAGTSLKVTVQSSGDRKPVAGATVEVRGLLNQAADTDESGVALVERIPAGGYQVVARAEGYAQSSTWTRIDGEGITEELLLVLKPGAAVAGRVVDPDGKPVEGAQVLYRGASDWAQQANPQFDAAITNAAGEFRIAALPAGTFRFHARHEEWAPGLSEQVTLDGRTERTGIVVEMEPGAVLAGTVVDTKGAPVVGAAVRVAQGGRGMRFERPRQTLSDEAGHFEMKALPRKPVNVVAAHDSATSQTVDVDFEASESKTDLELVLDVDGKIAGTVVDANGEPVEGAQVTLWPNFRRGGDMSRADWRLRGMPTELSDAGGRFEFSGLVDTQYSLRANPPGVASRGRSWFRESVDAQVGDTNVVITLETDGGIKGKVAMKNGDPPEAFVVSVGGWRGSTPFSSKDGSFELGDLPPNTYNVTIRGVGFEPKSKAEVVVEPGKVTDLGTITVHKGRSISGRVLSTTRQPVPGATVLAGRMLFGTGSSAQAPGRFGPPGSQNIKSTETDENGEFSISGVGSGQVNLLAEHDTLGRTAPVNVPASEESTVGLELIMTEPGALEGIVTVDGKPEGGIRISCQSQTVPSAMFGVATGEDGKFRFDKLAPDSYMVSAMSGGNPMRGMSFNDGKQVVIEPGQTATVSFEIETGSDIVVTFAPTNGDMGSAQVFTAQNASITAKTAAQLQVQIATRTGGQSTFGIAIGGQPKRISGIAPGKHTVCAVPMPRELRGMRDSMDYLAREGDNLPVYCTKVSVTAEVPEVQVELPLEIPAFVPPPPESDDS